MGGGLVSSVKDGGRELTEGAGPGPVVQWRLPLTGSVSYPPGRHGRASHMAAALELQKEKDIHVSMF